MSGLMRSQNQATTMGAVTAASAMGASAGLATAGPTYTASSTASLQKQVLRQKHQQRESRVEQLATRFEVNIIRDVGPRPSASDRIGT